MILIKRTISTYKDESRRNPSFPVGKAAAKYDF
jgi:hypothetical protein